VSYLLRMSGEIHDWLAGLHRTDAPAAMLAGQALAALMTEGASLGPPLVVPVAAAWPEDLVAALDSSYEHRLERLQVLRRRAAEAAWLVKDIQAQIDELESAQARLEERRGRALEEGRREDADQAARQLAAAQRDATQARQLVPWITETEAWLRTRLQRLQARTDAFRTRKEVLKGKYAAARAEVQAYDGMPDPGPADDEATTKAVARLRDVTAEIERELGRQALPEGLLELRPAALRAPGAPDALCAPGRPGDAEIRIIFAVEPPGTALLIAVLEDREAARDHYRDAVMLSADVLLEARAGQAPEASAHGYDDTRSFAEEFFPGQSAEIETGAANLAARNRAHTLAEQRTRLGLTQTEVADRMGIPRDQVAAIERADPGTTDVRTLAAYIAALGGRLEITADFAGDRIPLR
jgi:phage shock protein A/DNA-binding XRE family transcriptional regulator